MATVKQETVTNRKAQIESLVAQTAPKADVITRALERQAKENAAKQEEEVLEQLRRINEHVGAMVFDLKRARAIEKDKRKKLTKLLEAKEQYEKDANWVNYWKVWTSI